MSYTNPKTMDRVSSDTSRKIVRKTKCPAKCPKGNKVCKCILKSTRNGNGEPHTHTYKVGNKYSSFDEGHRHKISANGKTLLMKNKHTHRLLKPK